MRKKIFLDNASTTKIDKKVLSKMIIFLKKNYQNPSSDYSTGKIIKKEMEKSRKIIAKKINSKKEEIFFTSGGTESNNLVLKGLFFENYPKKNHIITTKIEHQSILKTCEWLEKKGAEITYLDVNREGFIDLKQLEKKIKNKTFLVSIIHGNNEIGTIQEIKEIGKICENKNILFHTDACQSFTKTNINVKKQKIDALTLNSHKIHGPKGVGAIYLKNKIKIKPLIHGGGQEKNLRSGTENTASIIGFGKAVEISKEKDISKMEKMKNILIKNILKIPKTKINGPIRKRLCNNINISFSNIEGESIKNLLEKKGFFVSTGSACSSNSLKKSHVFEAIKISPLQSNSSIRISISKYTTKKEIYLFLKEIKKIVKKLRKISPIK